MKTPSEKDNKNTPANDQSRPSDNNTKNSTSQGTPGSVKNESAPGGKQSLVNLPKGGGAIRGMGEKFQANPVTGTGSFTVPLTISPGRGQFTPQLALSYDSGSGNGPFGLGWSVCVPSITRKTDKGLPLYDENANNESDTFILSGAEDLVPLLEQVNIGDPWTRVSRQITIGQAPNQIQYTVYPYCPRIEGLFAIIERWLDTSSGKSHWRSISKDNITSVYGITPDACIADPVTNRKIFTWLIEKSWDAKGNLIEFEYKREDDINVPVEVFESKRLSSGHCFTNRYLKQVRYGNAVMYTPAYPTIDEYTDGWHFKLVFDYDDDNPAVNPALEWSCRQDAFSTYKASFEIRTYRLCKRVLMFHYFPGKFPVTGNVPILVRSTDLEYDENPYLSILKSVTHHSYNEGDVDELPSLDFTYSEAVIGEKIYDVNPSMLKNLPSGVDGNNYQWADLYSEGISGILKQDNNAWYFIPNKGDSHYYENLAPGEDPEPELVLGDIHTEIQKPAAIKSRSSSFHLGDVDSDGLPELVINAPGISGYYTRDEKDQWQPFKPFAHQPNINMGAAEMKMLDLTGDGLADLLIGKGDFFEIYFSEGKAGYSSFRRIRCAANEENGPKAVFSDELRRIYLADMSGDGLSDIVRITNSSVCYWPNLGYGRFGEKVTMKDPPLFDRPDQFNPSRLRLADVDATGTTDIIYLGSNAVKYWKNKSGNAWSEASEIKYFPRTDSTSNTEVVDLLGNGTSCLVWSSSLPAKSHRMRYLELTSGIKPYLLTEINNNMGGITKMQYAPSTKFYLRDKEAGKPWITRLSFPVHVLERVETRDEVSGSIFVNLYAYHHGYYDHAEREFRGFAMVEQWDTEQYSAVSNSYIAEGANIDEDSFVPPVYTKTWFHTGFFKNRNEISSHYIEEYFSTDTQAWLLPDTILPSGLAPIEAREACRALKGSALRKEVYAQDGSALEGIPYIVEEKSYNIKMLQPKAVNKHAVYHVTESETIAYQYERIADDPRILHSLVLETDEYGNITKSAQVAYPRRTVPQDMPEQGCMHIVYTENNFAKIINTPGVWLLGVNYEIKSYEVTGHSPVNDKVETAYLLDDILHHSTLINFLDPTSTGVEIRKIQHDKVLFWDDDLSDSLSLGDITPLALPWQKQSLEFTDDLIAKFNEDGTKITNSILLNEGKYIQDGSDWWTTSEIQTFDDTAFYLPVSIEDPFENITHIGYDDYNLLIETITDALNYVTTAENNYRMLQPWKITDPNGNGTAVQFDTLGMVCAMAVIGVNGEGDTLNDPTIIYEYDLHNWQDNGKPVYSHIKSRETHADENTRWLEMYTYTSGLGQELQTKVQAEDGDAWQMINGTPTLVQNVTDRWTATGRTILNNKGKVVKQYEPWFSTTHDYEPETELTQYGVTPIMHYDPPGRNIRTDLPDGTFTKVEFTPWQQKQYDQNDTSADSPWYIDNGGPDPQGSEPSNSLERAAWLSAQHYNTPQTQHFDTLGRVFLIEDDNLDSVNGKYCVRNKLDITGRPLMVTDAKGREITTNIFALKQQIITENIDSGKRWMLTDTSGKPLRAWDQRGHVFRNTYDELQRPLEMHVTTGSSTILSEKYQYGTNDNGNNPSLYNIGRIEKLWDQSGLTHITCYDFKGNPLESIKQYCTLYDTDIDWSQSPSLQSETFTQNTQYDALNRPVLLTQPDGSNIRYTYNKAALLEMVEVQHLGTGNYEEYVTNINYNEKGQRTDIYYGNGSKTRYYYDNKTFRLTRLLTTRNTGQDILQDLNYIYDAVGNIVEINDAAQQTFYYSNTVIYPQGKYWYDPLYRLIKATGRELTSLAMSSNEDFLNDIPVPNTDTGAMQNYTQHYVYDTLGNIEQLDHYTSGQNPNWSREYVYDTATNQLLKHDQQQTLDDYTYDEHGNMLTMPHLQSLSWNLKDQLSNVELNTQGDTAYYIYDHTGNRVRKVIEKGSIREERNYLGGYEVYRKFVSGDLDFERQTLHIDDDKKKVALIETKTFENGTTLTTPEITIRYQYDNHLGTACIELDEDAEIISYEEYHPFGTTSYRSGRTETEVSLKRFKYVGKERDEETGLYYYGARYYAVWICRFVSVDPLQHKYPHYTPFQYAGNKPISYIDLDGLEEWKKSSGEPISPPEKNPVGPLSKNYQEEQNIVPKTKDVFYNLKGEIIGSGDSGSELKTFVLTKGLERKIKRQMEHFGTVNLNERQLKKCIPVPTPEIISKMDQVLSSTDITGITEFAFAVGIKDNDQITSDIVKGNTSTTEVERKVDIRPAEDQVKKLGYDVSYTVHSHVNAVMYSPKLEDYLITDDAPSESDKKAAKENINASIRLQITPENSYPSEVDRNKAEKTPNNWIKRTGDKTSNLIIFYNNRRELKRMEYEKFKNIVNNIK